jgi:uncharacterized protein (TIGR02145 family)
MIKYSLKSKKTAIVKLFIGGLMIHGIFTQVITNTNQSIENGRIFITFDLQGESYLYFNIILTAERGSELIQPKAIVGDVLNVSPGTNKLIWWEPTLEGKTLNGWNLKINLIMSGLVDIDHNQYKTVIIGEQVWMAENLKVTHYRNGDTISAQGDRAIGSYAVYDDSLAYSNTYGNLYNWFAVDDKRGICPDEWHVPNDDEWTVLTDLLGENNGSQLAGDADRWYVGNLEGDSEFGASCFNALPGGYVSLYSGHYIGLQYTGKFWSSSAYVNGTVWSRELNSRYIGVLRSNSKKQNYFSVRCILNTD